MFYIACFGNFCMKLNSSLFYLILIPIAIVCLLQSSTNDVAVTNPKGKNIFQIGDSVEIKCSQKYWVLGTKQRSRTIRCKENGNWEFNPVCEGKITKTN